MRKLEQTFAAVKLALVLLHPDLPGRLNSAASAEKIEKFEQETQIQLPDSIRELYGLADGCSQEDGIFGGWVWLELNLIENCVEELQISLESACLGEECKSLVPIFQYNGTDFLCFRQNKDGCRLYYIPGDEPAITPVADSVTDFLEQFLARLIAHAFILNQYETRLGTRFSVRPPTREYWPPDFDSME
ncbi:SMI1/KNR4 family protein [Undibacterium sp. Ji83W]|uniref:SMI1/KNR4 family protein n=1 Tax=Undibacterium sp. Ji83W TaxID=3413043 RepID=UPI003BF30A46